MQEEYKICLRFEDGAEGVNDFPSLIGRRVFRALRDSKKLAEERITDSGAIAWNENLEICSDSLYMEITGMNLEDVSP